MAMTDAAFNILVTGLWMAITTDSLDLLPTDRSIYLWWFTKKSVARALRESKCQFLRALHLLVETLKWRRANGVDNATEPDSEYFAAARTCGVNGIAEVFGRLDRAGRAYVMFKPFSGLVEGDVEKAAIYTIERAIRLAKATQKIVLIVDCTTNNGLAVPLKRARSIARLLMRHYPQTLAKVVVVGSTFRQRLTYFLFASVLPRVVRKKVLFHHTNVRGSIDWKVPPYNLDQGLMHEDIGGNYPCPFDLAEYMNERPWDSDERSVLETISSDTSEDSEGEIVESIVRKIPEELRQICDPPRHHMVDAFESRLVPGNYAALCVAS